MDQFPLNIFKHVTKYRYFDEHEMPFELKPSYIIDWVYQVFKIQKFYFRLTLKYPPQIVAISRFESPICFSCEN